MTVTPFDAMPSDVLREFSGITEKHRQRFAKEYALDDQTGCVIRVACARRLRWRRHSYAGLDGTNAHRRVYQLCVGPIERPLVIHHTCERKDCIRPAHLLAMTYAAHRRLHLSLSAQATNEIRRRA